MILTLNGVKFSGNRSAPAVHVSVDINMSVNLHRFTHHTHTHTILHSAFLRPPCLQSWAISRASVISVPPPSLSTLLPYPCGHLYSSTYIYCHPASVEACSELPSHLASCSASFAPSPSPSLFLCLSLPPSLSS